MDARDRQTFLTAANTIRQRRLVLSPEGLPSRQAATLGRGKQEWESGLWTQSFVGGVLRVAAAINLPSVGCSSAGSRILYSPNPLSVVRRIETESHSARLPGPPRCSPPGRPQTAPPPAAHQSAPRCAGR